jgi:peptidoglycan/xylan/chitin deacetylase (PgdA/CDA1 family)
MRKELKKLVQALTAPLAPLVWRARPAPRLLVLMYHRVLPERHPDRAYEQPGMYVSPETLALHVEILKRHFEIVHLDEWARKAVDRERLPRLACALTFDDGWRDNFDYAFPVLRAQSVPATIYLLSDLVGTRYSFWPNKLARLLGDARNNTYRARWPQWLGQVLTDVGVSAGARLPIPMQYIDAAIGRCKVLYPDAEITELVSAIATAGQEAVGDDRDLMNWDEIRRMAEGGKIRFGSHTRRHTRLEARVPLSALQDEICVSRTLIEQQLQVSVTSFCYPNGDHCPAAVDLVRTAYATAVTTQRGWNRAGTDTYLLKRVGVHEDVSSSPSAFLSRLLLA